MLWAICPPISICFSTTSDQAFWMRSPPSVKTFTQTQSSPPGLLAPADLEPTPDGTDVVVRLTAPVVDSPYLGGLDWGRWGGASPAQVGTTFGGQGVCVGADSIRMGQTWVVSISSDPTQVLGWVHIVRSIAPITFP